MQDGGVRSIVATLGVLLTIGFASCTRYGSAHLSQSNGSPRIGVAFVGDDVITYEAWEVELLERGPVQNPLEFGKDRGKVIGSGTVVCVHDPERDGRRVRSVGSETGFDIASGMWLLDEWVSMAYEGWMWFGKGIWKDSLIPSDVQVTRSTHGKRYFGVDDVLDAVIPQRNGTRVLISIVPPVFGCVYDDQHGCLVDHGCRAASIGGLMCNSPDLECVVSELWCVRPAEDGERIHAHRLLPEGTTMTIREIFQQGPRLWRKDLDAMTDWLEPRAYGDPKQK